MSVVENEGGAAPGTGETPATPPGQSAGTENTDTGQGGGPPETVPYSRFKEVNDELKGIRDPLKPALEIGYTPDDLLRLAEWEQEFSQNPAGSWIELAKGLKDLPEPVKEAIKSLEGTSGDEGSGTKTPEPTQSDEPPTWAKPLIDDYQTRQQRDQQAQREAAVNQLVAQWKALDAQAKIKSPKDELILTMIAGNTGLGDPKKILETARAELYGYREESLEGVVVPKGKEPPTPVPGGAPPVQEGGAPKTFAEAKARARAAQERGEFATE
jgi:hypothetical protein